MECSAQPGDRAANAGPASGLPSVAASRPGQVAFGALHRGQLPGPVAVEQGQQVAGGGVVGQVGARRGGQRAGHRQFLGADAHGGGVVQGGAAWRSAAAAGRARQRWSASPRPP